MNQFFADSLAPLYRYITKDKYRTYVNLLTKYGGKKRFQSQQIKFSGYSFHVIDTASFLEHYRTIIAEEIYKFNSDKESPLIYDCGANIGISILYFKMLFPQSIIKAFEADPAIAKVLSENIGKNKLNDVEVIDKAVWKDDNGIEFGQEGADAGSIFNPGKKIKIPSIRLKDLLEKEKHIDFLKIDIEGAETEVLLDCAKSLQNVEKLFVEYHSYNGMKQDLDKLLKILTESGFRYFVQAGNFRKFPFVNKMENEIMDLQLNISCYR